MLTAVLLASTLVGYSLPATDDVWIYPHAYDQTGDPVLRAWGDGAESVGDPNTSSHSYSIVRFDLGGVKESAKEIKKATLVLWHESGAGFSLAESKAAPLEARFVDAGFDEKKWTFEQLAKHSPSAGEKALVGAWFGSPSDDGAPFKISINLLGGKADFRKALDGKKAVAFALCTKMAPDGAEGVYYKLLSRSAEEKFRPTLVLEF